MKKKFIFKFTFYSSTSWLILSSEFSLFFYTSFFIFEARGRNENKSFRRIFAMKDKLELILNERVI